MILEALYTKLKTVMAAYPLIGDIEATTPFCMFKADAAHVRDKTGIVGYQYTVLIGVVDTTILSVNSFTESIIEVMNTVTGTIDGTTFDGVQLTDESGVYHVPADNMYINDLEFTIFTTNR